jgi:ribose-phosphate pyrophosphokinase
MILLNGTPLEVTRFPDNTTQVWKLPEWILEQSNYAHITWEFTNEGEFLELAQLKMLLDSHGFTSDLRIKYLPYGRQDKQVTNKSTFALRPFAKLLNYLKFREVFICDPHSEVATHVIENARPYYPTEEVAKVMSLTQSDLVCYPDHGAVSKYTKIYDYPHIYGEKVRDQLTGNILSYTLVGECAGKNVLIVDDICDGGMTFKLLAKDLLAAGAKEVNLFVSHGIFSRGLRTLKESNIKRVFTKDGEVGEHQDNITYRRL